MHERDDDEDCETYQVGQNVPLKDRDVCLAVTMSMFPLLVVFLKSRRVLNKSVCLSTYPSVHVSVCFSDPDRQASHCCS